MLFFIALVAAAYFSSSGAARTETQPDRVCFSTAESREKIHTHRLFEPFQLLRATASRLHAEAIGVKLCRWHENLIYELSLLHHDGRIIYVFVNAENGQPIGSKNER
jgi:hypothetical protein